MKYPINKIKNKFVTSDGINKSFLNIVKTNDADKIIDYGKVAILDSVKDYAVDTVIQTGINKIGEIKCNIVKKKETKREERDLRKQKFINEFLNQTPYYYKYNKTVDGSLVFDLYNNRHGKMKP
jgi:hypothetical protein